MPFNLAGSYQLRTDGHIALRANRNVPLNPAIDSLLPIGGLASSFPYAFSMTANCSADAPVTNPSSYIDPMAPSIPHAGHFPVPGPSPFNPQANMAASSLYPPPVAPLYPIHRGWMTGAEDLLEETLYVSSFLVLVTL